MKEVEKKDTPDVSGGYNPSQEVPACDLPAGDYPPIPGPLTCPDPDLINR